MNETRAIRPNEQTGFVVASSPSSLFPLRTNSGRRRTGIHSELPVTAWIITGREREGGIEPPSPPPVAIRL